MDSEKILLVLVFAALAAIIIVHVRRPAIEQVLNDPERVESQDRADMVRGPAYTIYNAPWAFAPPVGNFMPLTSK